MDDRGTASAVGKAVDAASRVAELGARLQRASRQLAVGADGWPAAARASQRLVRRQSQILYEPPSTLSMAGVENQALDVEQILAIITDLCTDGFTLHSAGARTLWFAIQTAENIGCPYVVYRESDRGLVLSYLLVRTDLPTPALPARLLGVVREIVAASHIPTD